VSKIRQGSTVQIRDNRAKGRAATFIQRTKYGKAAGLPPKGGSTPAETSEAQSARTVFSGEPLRSSPFLAACITISLNQTLIASDNPKLCSLGRIDISAEFQKQRCGKFR
jgi:hypothetical protein